MNEHQRQLVERYAQQQAASQRDIRRYYVEVEFGGNLETSLSAIKENGVIATYASMAAPTPALPFYPLMFKAVTLRLVLVYILSPEARARSIANLTRALEAGALTHPVAGRFSLEEIARAHEAVEAGDKLGQVLVTIG